MATHSNHTQGQTSVLFLQKWRSDEERKTLVTTQSLWQQARKPGKNNSGDYVFKTDANGNIKKMKMVRMYTTPILMK